MESRKFLISQTLTVLAGELLVSGIMVLVFAVLGHYDRSVLLGGIAGALIATFNHATLVLGVILASKKAENQDVKGGQAAIQLSYMGRLLGLFLILVLCAKTELFNLLALVIPILFSRPILTVADYFIQKKGGSHS